MKIKKKSQLTVKGKKTAQLTVKGKNKMVLVSLFSESIDINKLADDLSDKWNCPVHISVFENVRGISTLKNNCLSIPKKQ